MGNPIASAMRSVISQSALPDFDCMTLRTRWMRRSALVKVPSFSRNVEPGRKIMGVVGGLVQEQVLHHDAFHRREAGRHMLGVGVGLQDVLALDVDALERAID